MIERVRLSPREPEPDPLRSPQSARIFGQLREALERDWRAVARPSQLAPSGAWTIWLLLAGRGFGKTRAGAEWVREQVKKGKRRIALVGATSGDTRSIMVEGESGLLACCPASDRPTFEPSRRLLTWRNGAQAWLYSAEESERLRGPQHDAAWVDELCSWRYPQATWDNLQLTMRLGKSPRTVITTTPKPTRLLRDLLARDGKDVVVTRGSTVENRMNLAVAFYNEIAGRYLGTRLGRQELDAEVLTDAPGSLWTRDLLDETRVDAPPSLRRIVVSIDPSTTSGENADETGLVVCGLGDDGHGYVLSDISGRYKPEEWARRAIDAYRVHMADRIIAEKNQGGEMIESTLRAVDPSVPVKLIHASCGKATRAEPVSALFEQHRCHLVGVLAQLEDELCNFTTGFDPTSAGFSPGRLDSMVWGFTELMLGTNCQATVDYFTALAANGGKISEEMLGGPLPTAPAAKPTPAPVKPAPPTVTLHAPKPFAMFQVDKARYAANGDGLVSVELDHVEAMIGMGCWPLAKPEGKTDAA